jgi:hypothetical protein
MIKSLQSITVISILIILSGCAGTSGKDFVRPTQETFKLGETTYSQVVQLLGESRNKGTSLVNDKLTQTIGYSYALTTGEPLEHGIIPSRAMNFSFLNGILVSQVFLSSFKSDHSNFDETKINAIVKGKTKRSEVIQLMGKPCCFYIPPMVKEPASDGIGYLYGTTMKVGSTFKNFTKSLTISFNENDEVSDINFHLTD